MTKIITIRRNPRGFGVSIMSKGRDIYVSKIVRGGQADIAGLKENEKIITINNQRPTNVDGAVTLIKEAGKVVNIEVEQTREMGKPPLPKYAQSKLTESAPQRNAVSEHLLVTNSDNNIREKTKVKSRGDFDQILPSIKEQKIEERVSSPTPSRSSVRSSKSLHNLGLDNYPYPNMPEVSKMTRNDEKQMLQHLNNRLGGYIDKVKRLETDNSRLNQHIRQREDTQNEEVSNVKKLYSEEVESLKDALHSLSAQFNQLKVASEGLQIDNQEMEASIDRTDRDLHASERTVSDLKGEIRELTGILLRTEDEVVGKKDQLKQIGPEVERLKERLAGERKQLDQELLDKANMDDRCARLDEELKFKIQLLDQQMEEMRVRREVEVTEMDSRLQGEYEDRLQDALSDLKDVYNQQMVKNKEELTSLYSKRVSDLESSLGAEIGKTSSSSGRFNDSRSRIESLLARVNDLETLKQDLTQRVAETNQNMEDKKISHRTDMVSKETELNRLVEELARQRDRYQILHDTKVALDMEIAVFRGLLESEEDRLGITT